MSISTNKGDVTVIELHKEPKNHAVEMKTYILDDLKALKKKFNMINHNPPIDVNGEASNGASINIDMKTSLFELMKEGFIDHLKKETDIQKLEFPVTSKAQSKNGDEADVEYHVDITFVVQGITEKVKMKCFTTNCRIQVQNFGKHTRKEHLGNEFSPKYFVNTFVVPYLESVKEKALEFDKIFVPHLRAEIQRLQKRKIQDRVRKSSALDIDPKNTKCVNNNCQWVNVILKNVEAYGICSACQGYEHHHCAGTSKMMKEEIKSGQVNFFCTNCMEKNPALGKDMLVSNCKMIVQVPGTPKPHNDNENQVQSLTYCPGEVVDDPAELYAGAGTGAVKRTGTEINQATSAGSEIKDGKIFTKVYCKTDHFPFEVISLPFLESNLDTNICYNVFYGQIVRFQRLTSLREDFEARVKYLASILIKHGYNIKFLCRRFTKALDKYGSEFQKWSLPLDLKSWFFQMVNGY